MAGQLSGAELLSPVTDDVPVTLSQLLFGATHEGALDMFDLLDRRRRAGPSRPGRGEPARTRR